jgi:ABC-2 type transport system ATP-binding protein
MTESNAIQVTDLRRVYKSYVGVFRRKLKEVVAVKGISFEVEPGELFGILGPNGAGKTTTVKMLTTLLIPTSGTATILGYDVVQRADAVRPCIGFIFGGERGLYWRLSAEDNLKYFAALYQIDPAVSEKRIPYLLELVGLKDRAQEKVEGYSRGMKQRLHIARTLLNDPEVMFLDEPSIGLDPVAARDIRKVVRDLRDQRKTILLTTHYMFEADELCRRIAVINHGEIVALDTPANLKRVVKDLAVVELEVRNMAPGTVERLKQLPFVDAVTVEEQDQYSALVVQSPIGAQAVPDLLSEFDGALIQKVAVREPTLEDAYVRLVEGADETKPGLN